MNAFNGAKKNKEYIYIEEMLTRKMLKLDNIESAGNEEIRSTRRQAVKTVEAMLDQLELKAFAHDQSVNDASKPAADVNKGQESAMETSEPTEQTNARPDQTKVNDFVLESEMKC